MIHLFEHRIILQKDLECIFMHCPFCDGYIPVEFEPDYNEDVVRVKGKCKKCSSYIQVKTQRHNVVTNWDYM